MSDLKESLLNYLHSWCFKSSPIVLAADYDHDTYSTILENGFLPSDRRDFTLCYVRVSTFAQFKSGSLIKQTARAKAHEYDILVGDIDSGKVDDRLAIQNIYKNFHRFHTFKVTDWSRVSRNPEFAERFFHDLLMAQKTIIWKNNSMNLNQFNRLSFIDRVAVIADIRDVNDNAKFRQAGIDKAKAAGVYARRRKSWNFKLFKRLAYQEKWNPHQSVKITCKKLKLKRCAYYRLLAERESFKDSRFHTWRNEKYSRF